MTAARKFAPPPDHGGPSVDGDELARAMARILARALAAQHNAAKKTRAKE